MRNTARLRTADGDSENDYHSPQRNNAAGIPRPRSSRQMPLYPSPAIILADDDDDDDKSDIVVGGDGRRTAFFRQTFAISRTSQSARTFSEHRPPQFHPRTAASAAAVRSSFSGAEPAVTRSSPHGSAFSSAGTNNHHQNEEAMKKLESLSILEALEHLEQLADDDEDDEEDAAGGDEQILTREEPLVVEPSTSPLRAGPPTSTTRQSLHSRSSSQQQLLRFKSLTDRKTICDTGSKKKDPKKADTPIDFFVGARRPPTTNFGGVAAATAAAQREDGNNLCAAYSSSNNNEDHHNEDVKLAMALQKEEDEYAAALRADRDRRDEEQRLLVMQLLEQETPNVTPPMGATLRSRSAPGIAAANHVVLPPDQTVHYQAPESIDPDDASDFALVNDSSWMTETDVCPICLESLCDGLVVSLRQCHHLFHLDCLDDLLQQMRRCPTCRVDVRSQHMGRSPSGIMTITRPVIQQERENKNYGGGMNYLERRRIIQIEYMIPNGLQKAYHDRPGHPYKGTTKMAYLPFNNQGTYLLKRLIFAFSHGMTFRITRSSSSSSSSFLDGEKSVVTWASIPHRVSLGDKELDSLYMASCNEALDQLGVPTSFKDTTFPPPSSY